MKKIVFIILSAFIIFLGGCSNNTLSLKTENEQLKSKVFQLEKELNDKNNKITEFQNNEINTLNINYIENKSSKSFVEKKCNLLALPVNNSVKLNDVSYNTVVTVLDTANVNNVTWLYVAIPIYDSPTNYKGWIKESDTVLYTKDKIAKVQSEVMVKKGTNIYETETFEDIKSVKPYMADGSEHGRIQEKKDGYMKVQCAGGRTIWVNETSVVYPEVD
ncbi:hypothetical protein [Candidatus Clostridium stratigraminis]|uniref:Uncharacterized protein n=1 Tax=Candidatus Clostridium stratigraminis TaxID=3381661 RepID=A0ABW8T7D1_9CLOT